MIQSISPAQLTRYGVARLLDLSDLSVDLVQLEHITPNLRTVIKTEGVEL